MTPSLEVRKQERESDLSLIRRFTQKVQQSGVLRVARAGRFRRRPKSQEMRKRAALRRVERKQEFAKLKKLGKI